MQVRPIRSAGSTHPVLTRSVAAAQHGTATPVDPSADATADPHDGGTVLPFRRPARRASAEDGSMVTEYGLLAVVAATIASVVMAWASNGALVTMFNALLRHARSLVGA